MEKLIIGSDHAAFEAKEHLKNYLKGRFEIVDVGPATADRCDYPKFAMDLCREVNKNNCLGILLCGSGIGMSMVANRFKGIRAALCRTVNEAELSKQHNNANVLCLGGRISTHKEIEEMSDAWFQSSFDGGRHTDRINMFTDMGVE